MKQNLIILSVLGVLILCIGGVYGYLYHSITTVSQTANQLNTELETEKSQVQSLEYLKELAAKAKTNRDLLMKFIVPGNNSAEAIAFVESLSEETGAKATLSSVNVADDPTLPQNTEYFVVSLALSGTWKQVMGFERILETMPYKAKVQSLELTSGITSPTTREWSGSYNFSLVKGKEINERGDAVSKKGDMQSASAASVIDATQ